MVQTPVWLGIFLALHYYMQLTVCGSTWRERLRSQYTSVCIQLRLLLHLTGDSHHWGREYTILYFSPYHLCCLPHCEISHYRVLRWPWSQHWLRSLGGIVSSRVGFSTPSSFVVDVAEGLVRLLFKLGLKFLFYTSITVESYYKKYTINSIIYIFSWNRSSVK